MQLEEKEEEESSHTSRHTGSQESWPAGLREYAGRSVGVRVVVYEGAVMHALVNSACAGAMYDGNGSRRTCVLLGGHAGCGGRAPPAAQATR